MRREGGIYRRTFDAEKSLLINALTSLFGENFQDPGHVFGAAADAVLMVVRSAIHPDRTSQSR